MDIEVEAKFLDADFDALRTKLQELGARCVQPRRLMRRKHFDYPDFRLGENGGFMRLRDEGDKITLSYKQVDDRTVQGTKEVTVTVSSFEATEKLLEILGLKVKSFHESYRESWRLGDAEIELDEWPWIPPLAEIEARDESELWELAKRLGLRQSSSMHGTVDGTYARYYEVTTSEVNTWPEITFTPVPDHLEKRRRS